MAIFHGYVSHYQRLRYVDGSILLATISGSVQVTRTPPAFKSCMLVGQTAGSCRSVYVVLFIIIYIYIYMYHTFTLRLFGKENCEAVATNLDVF